MTTKVTIINGGPQSVTVDTKAKSERGEETIGTVTVVPGDQLEMNVWGNVGLKIEEKYEVPA